VWSPCFIQSFSVEGIPALVLLANGIAGGRGFSPKVQRMSNVCTPDSSAGISIEDYPIDLALCYLGSGYGQSI
jgi:hypothetical protein